MRPHKLISVFLSLSVRVKEKIYLSIDGFISFYPFMVSVSMVTKQNIIYATNTGHI